VRRQGGMLANRSPNRCPQIGARHPVRRQGGMLANRVPKSVLGTRYGARWDASKQGAQIGARHPVRRSMAVTNASPETSSSGRLNGSIRPTQMPLRRIHERGRMISASTMPPSLPSAVIDNLAQVDQSGCNTRD
jgi:hypothetical protein